MNQDFNNLNQNTNDVQTNQPVYENQTYTTLEQPIQQNNIGSPKKFNFGLIAGIGAVAIAAVVGSVLIFGGGDKTNDSSNGKNNEKVKDIVYFNKESINVTDKVGFTIDLNNKSVFFGIEGKGIANNLKGDSYYLNNDLLTLSSYYSKDELSIQLNKEYFNLELETVKYEKNETGEYVDNNQIVYKEGNYFVVTNNINSYTLYYLFEENYYGQWGTLLISFPDTLDSAKQIITKIKSNVNICIYDKNASSDNCLTDDGKSINYKEYKHINDVLIDSLKEYNLYLDSYEDIYKVDNGDIKIVKEINYEGLDIDDETRFEIDFNNTLNPDEVVTTSELNGQKVQYRKPYSLYYAYLEKDSKYTEIYIDLPYGVDETDENAKNVMIETFSKTK